MTHPTHITFRDMDPSDAVSAAIQERSDKLARFHDRIAEVRAVVETPHQHRHKGRAHLVQLHIDVPGGEVTVSHEPENGAHEDVYVTIRDAFEAAERQLKARVERQIASRRS